ncbi:hypothetical protein SASPL_145000 [Salvia splendens]|uniref:soluble epoxide hydrolase n=1 Tax=Salvia splendens TaxID=180675 RepID=A0A8X8WGV0_SALSN|nr:epoxide hydrolase A-like [Salvia splendens]KAG6394416.1 hypothetical protein SASPL_145000 [Salvia splendens]
MDHISHKQLTVNGISMHVAEAGDGSAPAVLFLHGFPELWYSWRHQMLDVAAKGYRAIAPDLRGYGDTDSPPPSAGYTLLHIVGDLVALLDALGLEQVFLVGHDWGAIIAWWFCLLRPDRIRALVNTSVIFQPRNPNVKTIQGYRDAFGDAFYMCRFQEEGKAEAAFASVDTKTVMATFLTTSDPKPPCIPVELGLDVLFKRPAVELPPWISPEDISYYSDKFDKTGFTGGLNYYRQMDLSWELTAPWTGAQIKVPVKFVIGDLDLTYSFPGVEEFINGGFKIYVPLLEEIVVMKGVGHFLNEESPHELSQHILTFINKF